MKVFLPQHFTGLNCHLVYEDKKVYKTQTLPNYSDKSQIVFGDMDYQSIINLYNIGFDLIPHFPSEPDYVALKTVSNVNQLKDIPWCFLLSPNRFKITIKTFLASVEAVFESLYLNYYWDHYKKNHEVLKQLQQAHIDSRAWKLHTMNYHNLATPHVFDSFKPDKTTNIANKIEYERNTRTGRLRVISGPNILLLPHEQRNLITLSRFGVSNGEIVYLDYSSLEPRVLLAITSLLFQRSISELKEDEDVYEYIQRELKLSHLDREIIKSIILQQLYGASYETILKLLSNVKDPSGIVDAINEQFGVFQLREKLLREYEVNEGKFILNFYGRKIDTTGVHTYKLLNYYVQSTAVDIALYGFTNMVQSLSKEQSQSIIPIFVLHDGILFDVHNQYKDHMNELVKIGAANIQLFLHSKFPIKMKKFN